MKAFIGLRIFVFLSVGVFGEGNKNSSSSYASSSVTENSGILDSPFLSQFSALETLLSDEGPFDMWSKNINRVELKTIMNSSKV